MWAVRDLNPRLLSLTIGVLSLLPSIVRFLQLFLRKLRFMYACLKVKISSVARIDLLTVDGAVVERG